MSVATEETDAGAAPAKAVRARRFARVRWQEPREFPAVHHALPGPIMEGQSRANVRSRDVLQRRALVLSDALAAILALSLAVVAADGALKPIIVAAAPLMVIANKLGGLYDRDGLVLHKTTVDDTPALFQISGLFALTIWLLGDALVSATLGHGHVLLLWAGTLLFLLIGRTGARAVTRRIAPSERCLMIGDRASIATFRSKLDTSNANAEVVATIELRPEAPMVDLAAFREQVRLADVDRVIVAPITTDSADTLDVIRVAKFLGVRVSLLPRLFEAVGTAVEFDELGGLTMLGVGQFGLSRSSLLAKRTFDLVGSTLAIVTVAPLMALIALAIRLDSPGPIFFRQVRVGRDGRLFEILKFRSMVNDAEARKHDLVHLNEAQGLFKIADDPRITNVGHVLRRWCLDELPQLLNVWRGEMSLVGPRPLVVDEDAKILGLDRSRLHLTPGMTGHWQVLGSTRIPMREMVAIDYLYVANWSLWTDLKLLLRTVPVVISRSGI
jgi:exopolysaccharide biosynthesis polyprenyl glycosylphosphotransferase